MEFSVVVANMEIMLEGSRFLETKGLGTNAARKTVRDTAYVAYFRATGLAMDTQREPTRDNLAWVKDEVEKQNKLLGIV